MKSATSAQRPYQEVGAMIRDLIIKTPYNPGERLPPEREIAEMLDVTRTVVREALIMLEIKGLVEVRRGAGIYVLDNSGSTLDAKTVAIISFALCGFANFGSIGVVVGAFSAVAPHRAPEIAQLGLRALAAATLSNLMSATIAGFFIGLA